MQSVIPGPEQVAIWQADRSVGSEFAGGSAKGELLQSQEQERLWRVEMKMIIVGGTGGNVRSSCCPTVSLCIV